jgi:hypothetical protein
LKKDRKDGRPPKYIAQSHPRPPVWSGRSHPMTLGGGSTNPQGPKKIFFFLENGFQNHFSLPLGVDQGPNPFSNKKVQIFFDPWGVVEPPQGLLSHPRLPIWGGRSHPCSILGWLATPCSILGRPPLVFLIFLLTFILFSFLF